MSSKIKSKDLNYDKSLPPFLQRLHDRKAGRGDTDRHEQPVARARRAKDPNDDDGPTMVDESGDNVSKEEYEKLNKEVSEGVPDTTSVKEVADSAGDPKMSGALPEITVLQSKVTDGTAQKKRKAVKAIGIQDDAEDQDEASADEKVVKKAKKKAKPVKLAFDDD